MRLILLLFRTNAKALITAAIDTYESRALTLGGDDFLERYNIFMSQCFKNFYFSDSSDWEAIFFLFCIDSFERHNLSCFFMCTDKNAPETPMKMIR
jgi:hypothetical protein